MSEARGDLTKKVLREVSRSFYLSLRILPVGMREGTGVAYLLARLSDTIADAGSVSNADRVKVLAGFCVALDRGNERAAGFEGLEIIKNAADLSAGEGRLLTRARDCFLAFDGLPIWQNVAARDLLGIITSGQAWDLTRFEGEGVVALKDDAELEKYCYQVAGCVGEFWTRMAAGQGKDFGGKTESEMMILARKYGEALQLINILRDVPEDLERGRCYLPGVDFLDDESARKQLLCERGRWILRARDGLESAHTYCNALSGRRLRMASRLPAMIGERTLDLLDVADWDSWKAGVKISRKAVRAELWQALWR